MNPGLPVSPIPLEMLWQETWKESRWLNLEGKILRCQGEIENRCLLPRVLPGRRRTKSRIQIQSADPAVGQALCQMLGSQEQKHHLWPLVAHSLGEQTDTDQVLPTKAPHAECTSRQGNGGRGPDDL